jgi:hypothetical protein
MKKTMLNLFVLAVAALSFFGTLPAMAWTTDREDVLHSGDHSFNGRFMLDEVPLASTATELDAAADLAGALTATVAELNTAADLSARVTTHSVTTNAASTNITLSAASPTVLISGGPNQTNAVNIVQPYPVGQTFTIIAAAANTNLIQFADSTSVLALGGTIDLGGTDTLTIYTVDSNQAVRVSNADN